MINKEYEIYYEAFDIADPEERRRFVLEQCGEDSTLFDNIMRLFPKDDEPLDDKYGKYEIERQIGKGGMGVVYLARFSEEFGSESFTRHVALKTINPLLKLAPQHIKMFLKEIKTLAELDHPNIARFLDIGTSEKGKPFFVMEYVDGASLTEYCNRKKLSIKERVAFFQQVLKVIDYSHRRGFIHCDIKPNNILVDTSGALKVIDFGIASKYGSYISGKSQTTFFQHAFTPQYASPEQIKGEKNLTVATDVYSLGVVLYELLTGQLPLDLDENKSYSELISTLEKTVPSALKRSVTKVASEAERERLFLERDCVTFSELESNLDSHLDQVVQRALNNKPQKRYASVGEFDDELAAYLNEDSFLRQIQTAGTILYRKVTRKFRRMSPAWAIAGVILILLVGVLFWQNQTVRTLPYYVQIKSAADSNRLDISKGQISNLKTAIDRTKKFILPDFEQAISELENNNPTLKNNVWSLANYIVGLKNAGYPMDANPLNNIIDKKATADGCWKEEQFACKLIISGWVMLAKKELSRPMSEQQLMFVLKNQSPEGWFPAYPYPEQAPNAASYPTAIILLGLTEQLQNNLIDPAHREQVEQAISRGAQWLMKTRNREAKQFLWSDCPNVDPISQTPSSGVDGTIIYVLHRIASAGHNVPELSGELRTIDSLWLDRLENVPNASPEHKFDGRCTTVTNEGGIMDRTVRFTIPWSVAATVEAFPNGTQWQKASALRWLDSLPLSKDFEGFTFGASEYLMAITYLDAKL